MEIHSRATAFLLASALLGVGTAFAPMTAHAQEDAARVVGTWEGVLSAVNLRLVFHVSAAEDGTLSATMDSPDQGATGIPVSSVSVTGDTVTFTVDVIPGGGGYKGTLSEDGATLDGMWSQGPTSLPLQLARVQEASGMDRPQEPAGPLPYAEEDVRFESAEAGVTLAGTVTTPHGPGPFPGAVLVSGSGPQDRNEALMGHKPFLVLADHLTRAGIAVLRYDDRGVGESTGDFASATTRNLMHDALAAVTFLDGRPDISQVGIIGHSEGGLIGPMAAAESESVSFVVMLAGPGLPGLDVIQAQATLIARAAGTPEEAIAVNTRAQQRLFEIVQAEPDPVLAEPRLIEALEASVSELPDAVRAQMGEAASREALTAQARRINSPWFRFFLSYDPRPTLERVSVPVLALAGGKDLQVPADENVAEIRAALERGGNPDATATVLSGLNHLFQTAGTGSPSEYGTLSETMSPVALNAVSSWIKERFAPTG